MKKILTGSIAALLIVILYACGGSGGSGGNASSSILLTQIPGISSSTLTVGSSNSVSGSTQVVLMDELQKLLNFFGNALVGSAYAQSIGTCSNPNSNQLVGSQNNATWSVIGLTTSSSTSSCVQSFQDAGNYIVLSTVGVTDANNNTCDLVVITKSSGLTTCINLALSNRALTGDPTFLLGVSAGQPGQLTANGNYFLVGFYTNNSNAAYIGFELLDFTSGTPVGKVAYAEYSTQVSGCDGTPSVNNHNIFWSSFWLQENSNFVFDQFNQTQCSVSPSTGTSMFYYVDVNNTSDPLNAIKYLFNINDVTSTNGYTMDSTSPLSIWLNNLVGSSASFSFGSEIYPGGSTSPTDLSFFIATGGGVSSSCSTGTGTSVFGVGSPVNGQELIKVVISNGGVTFQDFGATNIGTGFGANPLTDNVYLTSDGSSLVSVHWMDDSGTMKVLQITRALSTSACDSYTKVTPTTTVSTPSDLLSHISTVGNGNFVAHDLPYTYRSKDYIYMYGFNSNPGDPNCVSTSGCQIATDAQIWAFDKTNNSVAVVPINQLTSATTFYSSGTTANPLSDKVSNTLLDSSGNKYWYSLNSNGITRMIKFGSSANISNGFVTGTN